MKKISIVIMILLVALLSGCATSGRFSLVDWDLRNPEQINAFYEESKVPYDLTLDDKVEVEVKVEVVAQPKSITASFIASIITAIKGRVRILSFEWKNK